MANYQPRSTQFIASWLQHNSYPIIIYCDRWTLPPNERYIIRSIFPESQDYDTNCEIKPYLMLDCLRQSSPGDEFIFLDADCLLTKPIDEILDADFDFAVTDSKQKNPIMKEYHTDHCAGVWAFKATAGAQDFAEDWIRQQSILKRKNPKWGVWDEMAMINVIKSKRHNIHFLDPVKYNRRVHPLKSQNPLTLPRNWWGNPSIVHMVSFGRCRNPKKYMKHVNYLIYGDN